MNFEIGDRITCIKADKYPNQILSGAPPNLVAGRDYIVYGVAQAPCCGSPIVDVGIIGRLYATTCGKCGGVFPTADSISWKHASRFIKKEESKKKEVAVSAIKLTRELSISEN